MAVGMTRFGRPRSRGSPTPKGIALIPIGPCLNSFLQAGVFALLTLDGVASGTALIATSPCTNAMHNECRWNVWPSEAITSTSACFCWVLA